MGSYISPPDQRSNSTKRAVPNYELHILFGDWKVTPHRKLTWKSKQWRLARYITFLFKMKVFHGYVLPRLNGIYNSNSLFQSTHQGWRLFLWHEVLLPWVFSGPSGSCGEIPTEGHPKQSQTHTLCYMSPLNITKLGWWNHQFIADFLGWCLVPFAEKGREQRKPWKSGWDISSYSQFWVVLPVLKTINNFDHLTHTIHVWYIYLHLP